MKTQPPLLNYGSTPAPPATLNEVYEILGLGPFQYLLWTLVFLVAVSTFSAPVLAVLSVVIPAIRCEWELSEWFEGALPIAMFLTSAICSAAFGKSGDTYGRKPVIIISTVVLLLSTVLSAGAPNKWVFLVGRVITGGCAGVNLSTKACYATEYAESKYRAIGIFIMLLGCFLGAAGVNVLAYFLLNTIGWRWFMVVAATPTVPAIIMMALLPESPRFLCVSGKTKKLRGVLDTMAALNKTTLPESLEVVVYKNEELGSWSALFDKANRRSVVSLSVAYFANVLVQFGLIIFLPLFFSSGYCGTSTIIPEHDCQLLSQEDLGKLALSSGVSILGPVIALGLATKINRLAPWRVGSFLIVLCFTGLLVCINHTVTLAVVTTLKLTETFVSTLLWIIMPETFATTVRATAIGFISAWSKIGGVVGAGMVYLLFYVSPTLVIGLFIGASIMWFVASLVFNKESKGLELQDMYEAEVKQPLQGA